MQGEPQCRLESLDSCGNVLAAYDAANDRLAFSSEGRFWKSIQHMHELGKRGAGRKVAIIDSACDLNHPRLKRVIDHVAENLVPASGGSQNLEHGTAVALLISEVAPDCRIDLYPVVREDGKPDIFAVRDAIDAAAESDAHVINLSLGMERPAPSLGSLIGDPQKDPAGTAEYLFHHKEWLAAKIPDNASCVLCPAASKAAAKGKLVFAAAGNASQFIYCPARAGGVIGVGFQQIEAGEIPTADGIGSETGHQHFPSRQSAWIDIVVDGMDGVLGTSFASPLRAAAAAALELTPRQQVEYAACMALAEVAIDDHMEWRANPRPDLPGVLEGIGKCYEEALRRLPHAHCAASTRLRPDLPLTDPSKCATCGYFFGDLYLDAGLFYLERRDLEKAVPLLQAARGLWPWSGEAAANLGAACRLQGRLDEALRMYDQALELRPGFPIYQKAREFILQQMPSGTKPVPKPAPPADQALPSVRPDPFFLPHFSGTWKQVSSSSSSKKKFAEELARLVPGWKVSWEKDRLIGLKREITPVECGPEAGGAAREAEPVTSLAVTCDGQNIKASAPPQSVDDLHQMADFIATLAGLLGWNMVKTGGGNEFLRAYQFSQLRRAMSGRKTQDKTRT